MKIKVVLVKEDPNKSQPERHVLSTEGKFMFSVGDPNHRTFHSRVRNTIAKAIQGSGRKDFIGNAIHIEEAK